ncbi:Hypothetical Protein FCC1311_099012 [Hondaea fermentalgiana]|uniref:Uncharacterized protein n=1 Tax=Hondaea fermentalgiana TaxID=2315210 RepID=A0A2R5GV80_9STRA|nr:Hypothetical Protein FCC1311_099012 [Hondaea fermentalgiana]|eukprot:GBG33678.1 Hypothetical Protein FCC1311_099012 [Hondaea fermentalgiana]
MLEYEAEEVGRRLRTILDRISTERTHRNGPQFCRKLVERELEHFVQRAQTADERELAICKDRLSDAKRESELLRKRVRELEDRVSNREDLLETQRLAFMKEIIGLKEALFGARRQQQVVEGNQGGRSTHLSSPLNTSSRVEVLQHASDADALVENFRQNKPGLGSFSEALDDATSPGGLLGIQNAEVQFAGEEENHLANDRMSYHPRGRDGGADGEPDISQQHLDNGAAISQKQKISILTARLQSAQARVASVIDEMASLQRAKSVADKENAELKGKLEFLERFDVKAIKSELAEAKAQLECEQELRRRNAAEALRLQTLHTETIENLSERVERAEPQLRSVLRTFSAGLNVEMDVFSGQVRRALSRSSEQLQRVSRAAGLAELQFQYHPMVVKLRREVAQKTARNADLERRVKAHERRAEETRKSEMRRLASFRKMEMQMLLEEDREVIESDAGPSALLSVTLALQGVQGGELEEGDTITELDSPAAAPCPSPTFDTVGPTAEESKRRATLRNSLTDQVAKLERMRSELSAISSQKSAPWQLEVAASEARRSAADTNALMNLAQHAGPASLCQLNVVLSELDAELDRARQDRQATRPKSAARSRRPESARKHARALHEPELGPKQHFPSQGAARPAFRSISQIVADTSEGLRARARGRKHEL